MVERPHSSSIEPDAASVVAVDSIGMTLGGAGLASMVPFGSPSPLGEASASAEHGQARGYVTAVTLLRRPGENELRWDERRCSLVGTA